MILASTTSGCATAPLYDGGVLFENFKLVDPETETVTERAYLIERDGVIAAIGSGSPPRSAYLARRDMKGAYATPGLIDTHAHLTLGPIEFVREPAPALAVKYDDAYTEHAARMLLAYGVTTIRNPAGDAKINLAYKKAVALGEIDGPEAVTAGPVLDRSPIPFFGLSDLVDASHQIESIVNAQADLGVDYIKLYHSLTEEDVARGVAAAHARGLPAIGHLSISWKKAADFGIDALVHAMPSSADDLEPAMRETYRSTARPGAFAFFEWWEAADLDGPVMRNVIRALAEKQVHVDLTLIAFKLAFWGDDLAVRDEFLSLSHPDLIENWRTFFRFDLGWSAGDYARAKAVWPKILKFARQLHDAGVPLTLGTDQANPFVAPGASLVQEMKLHREAGISGWAVLRLATCDAARILRLGDETGSLKPGLDADVVFVAENPALNLDTFLAPVLVLNNGRVFDPDALRAAAPSPAGR